MNSYSAKWILQRITAILLIPLTFWFIYHCISFQHLSYAEIVFFFSSYFNSFLFLILMISMLVHVKIGCESIVVDYFSSNKVKIYSIWIIKLISYLAIIISTISIFSIVF